MTKQLIGFCLLIVLLCWLTLPSTGLAADKTKVLIVYDLKDNEHDEQVYMTDLLVGHFTQDITTLRADKLDEAELNDYSHLVYIHTNEKKPSGATIAKLDGFKGGIFHIGRYSEMFKFGSFLSFQGVGTATHIIDDQDELELDSAQTAIRYETDSNTDVLYDGKSGNTRFPLIFRHDDDMVIATDGVTEMIGNFAGEAMFDFFDAKKRGPQRYIRLEDVHPKSDKEKLKEIGDYLEQKGIPYMITLIPVYTNPRTGEEIHLSDEPKLVKILQNMQSHGASIILHGYKHQYRNTETGEGYEYWDEKNDRPIYQKKNEKALLRNDFGSEKAFQEFIKKGEAFEQKYISGTLDKGIRELNEQKLYPLAFEPSHYAMSLEGYREVANYFSTYVGEAQISNKTNEITFTTVFTSRASFLHGMKLVPETLGYVDPGNKDAIKDILDNEAYYSRFSDSQLGLFYHPYLGLDKLKTIIEELEQRENYPWFDLKQTQNKAETEGIVITSGKSGIDVSMSGKEKARSMFVRTWWVIPPAIIYLLIVIISIRGKKKKTNSLTGSQHGSLFAEQ